MLANNFDNFLFSAIFFRGNFLEPTEAAATIATIKNRGKGLGEQPKPRSVFPQKLFTHTIEMPETVRRAHASVLYTTDYRTAKMEVENVCQQQQQQRGFGFPSFRLLLLRRLSGNIPLSLWLLLPKFD